jgi:hypothetical protein
MKQLEQLKVAVSGALEVLSDDYYFAEGFTRRRGVLRYDRKLKHCNQRVELSIEHLPKDNTNAIAALYPWLTVQIPMVDDVAVRMTGSDDRLLAIEAPTLIQPIEFVSPNGIGARWFIDGLDSAHTAVQEFVTFSLNWVFSFLIDYSTAAGVVTLYENADTRVIHDEDQFLRVIAAMLVLERTDAALEVFNSKFGRPASRRRFARVLEFIQSKKLK